MIKFVKLVTGETVIGSYNEVTDSIEDVALVQLLPGSNNVHMAIVPYGFPFEEKVTGRISMDKVIYEFENPPGELVNKYLEAKSNIKISSSMPGESAKDLLDIIKKD